MPVCDRWTEATTDEPTPKSSPIPVVTMKSGATILTAANASLPTPRPTNTPSAIVMHAIQTIPSNVGKKILRNRTGMFILPKSIRSLCITQITFYFGLQK